MSWNPSFIRYRGDGVPAQGEPPRKMDQEEKGAYLPDKHLIIAVNTALAVGQPLLVTGEPGTGKTALAWSVAAELGLGEVLEFHTRSDHHARDTLYSFDNLRRFYDAQNRDARTAELSHYVQFEALGTAITGDTQRVVLIDEIDKAPRDFPNDLLDEIDRMSFLVSETRTRYKAKQRPVVIITSNSERQLPAPFLRRCVFHHIAFPGPAQLKVILEQRIAHLNLSTGMAEAAIRRFTELRALESMEKVPATSELITWVRVLIAAGVPVDSIDKSPLAELPLLSALVKTRADLDRVGKQTQRATERSLASRE